MQAHLSKFGLMVVAAFAVVIPAEAADTTNLTDFDNGVVEFRARNWDMAIWNFSEAIRVSPTNAILFTYRGYSYLEKGEFEKSISDFSRQIQLEPTNSFAYCNRAGVYRFAHEWDKALADYNECLRLNPANAEAYKGRASVREFRGEFGQAIDDWNQGLRLTPNDDLALTYRAKSYASTSQFGKALDDCRKAIQINPKNDSAYNYVAWLRATCPDKSFRNGEEAVEAATKACELTNWTNFDWIDTLAAAYAEAGNFDQAVRYEKQAMGMKSMDKKYFDEMHQHLSLYESHKPYHQEQ